MRNRYPGDCYRCGQWVPAGAGHFEKVFGGWRVQHAECAIKFRGQADPVREAITEHQRQRRAVRDAEVAKGTGRKAQRARKRLRDREQEGPPA